MFLKNFIPILVLCGCHPSWNIGPGKDIGLNISKNIFKKNIIAILVLCGCHPSWNIGPGQVAAQAMHEFQPQLQSQEE